MTSLSTELRFQLDAPRFDWNGDGEFSSTDLVKAFQDGGFEAGARPAPAQAVPEPTSLAAAVLACLCLATGFRRIPM